MLRAAEQERFRKGEFVVAPVLLDANRGVTAAYRVTGTPTVYLVDRRSQIVGRAIGRREWAGEEGRRLLAALLKP